MENPKQPAENLAKVSKLDPATHSELELALSVGTWESAKYILLTPARVVSWAGKLALDLVR